MASGAQPRWADEDSDDDVRELVVEELEFFTQKVSGLKVKVPFSLLLIRPASEDRPKTSIASPSASV